MTPSVEGPVTLAELGCAAVVVLTARGLYKLTRRRRGGGRR